MSMFWVGGVFRRWELVEGRKFIDATPLTGYGEIPALPSSTIVPVPCTINGFLKMTLII
jgi:hypothetical protein